MRNFKQVRYWNDKNIYQFLEDILNTLKSEGLYRSDLLYRAFSNNRIRRVRRTGTDRDDNSPTYSGDCSGGLKPRHIIYVTDKTSVKLWHGSDDGISVYDPNDLILLSHVSESYLRPDKVMPLYIFKIKLKK